MKVLLTSEDSAPSSCQLHYKLEGLKKPQSNARNVKWTRVSSRFEDQTKKNFIAFARAFSGAEATKVHSGGAAPQSNKEAGESKSFHLCFPVWIINMGLWILRLPDYWNNKNLKRKEKKNRETYPPVRIILTQMQPQFTFRITKSQISQFRYTVFTSPRLLKQSTQNPFLPVVSSSGDKNRSQTWHK